MKYSLSQNYNKYGLIAAQFFFMVIHYLWMAVQSIRGIFK